MGGDLNFCIAKILLDNFSHLHSYWRKNTSPDHRRQFYFDPYTGRFNQQAK